MRTSITTALLALALLIQGLARIPGPGGAAAGVSGSRAFVAASNESIQTTTSAPINNLAAFTIGVWVNPTSAGGFNIGTMVVKDGANAYTDFASFASVALVLNFNKTCSVTGGNTTTTTALSLNTWAYVLYTFDKSGDAKIHSYINNVETSYAAQVACVGTVTTDAATGFTFGNDTFGSAWDGRIAEVAVWNEVLSGGNRAAAYASTSGVAGIDAAHLVGYWHLCGKVSPEPDSSGNGNSGTLSAPPPTGSTGAPGFSGC